MKISLLMNTDTWNCLWILVFPNGIIEVSNSRKCCFWLYFSSLQDYWPPSTWNLLVHTSWGETERREKRAFQLLKLRKKKISWNLKTKCVTDFLLTFRSSSMKDYIVITWWAHKGQTFTLISIKIMRIGNFLFTSKREFKHKEVVSNLHICSNGPRKMWPSYTFKFSTRILTSTHTKVFNIFFA
jgi:hypothetical protein